MNSPEKANHMNRMEGGGCQGPGEGSESLTAHGHGFAAWGDRKAFRRARPW